MPRILLSTLKRCRAQRPAVSAKETVLFWGWTSTAASKELVVEQTSCVW